MSALGDNAGAVLSVLSIVGLIIGGARVVWRWLQKSKQREIDERVTAAFQRRAQEQEDGTPVEKELRRQLTELKQELAEVRTLHRREIADLREEHDRELGDVRRQLSTEIDVLRGQLNEAYRTRPNAAGSN